MKPPVSYATATAFRQALEARLMTLAREEQVDVQRLRRQVAFDRMLCRLFNDRPSPWALKGGYAMELRMAAARTTRDVDLAVVENIRGGGRTLRGRLLDMLQTAAEIDLHDYFIFLIGEPVMDIAAAPYGGGRYPVEARMDGRTFARFHIDVGIGDARIEPLEQIKGRDWLVFAGIPGTPFPAISREQQFAEKFHAYTLPRAGIENTRVRDLVDLTLLIRRGRLNRARTASVLKKTFDHRDTHPLPKTVAQPPDNWLKPFASLAAECDVQGDANEAHDIVMQFVSQCSTRAVHPKRKTALKKRARQ